MSARHILGRLTINIAGRTSDGSPFIPTHSSNFPPTAIRRPEEREKCQHLRLVAAALHLTELCDCVWSGEQGKRFIGG